MRTFLYIIAVILIIAVLGYVIHNGKSATLIVNPLVTRPTPTPMYADNPLSIAAMRARAYPGSTLTIEQTLADGVNYHQYVSSYLSDGYKIYGLLTVPLGQRPTSGWPVIIFNHGYIPPNQYVTTERYVAYVADIAKSGYIVFKSDYRGNGNSEGQPQGAYYSPSYTIDVLNAISSIKNLKDPSTGVGGIANASRIGMWGHSMGGNITLRSLVVDPEDIKVAVIWGGVVSSYYDLMYNWQRNVIYRPPPSELANRNSGRQQLISLYGPPASASAFWQSIDPTAHLSDIAAPIQLHTGGSDEEVPMAFSQSLYAKLQALGKMVEYYNYPGGDHNISDPNFTPAMDRTIQFFDTYLK